MALQKSFQDVLERVKKGPYEATLSPELDKVDEKDVKLFRCACWICLESCMYPAMSQCCFDAVILIAQDRSPELPPLLTALMAEYLVSWVL